MLSEQRNFAEVRSQNLSEADLMTAVKRTYSCGPVEYWDRRFYSWWSHARFVLPVGAGPGIGSYLVQRTLPNLKAIRDGQRLNGRTWSRRDVCESGNVVRSNRRFLLHSKISNKFSKAIYNNKLIYEILICHGIYY
jgi:hypothetical protein